MERKTPSFLLELTSVMNERAQHSSHVDEIGIGNVKIVFLSYATTIIQQNFNLITLSMNNTSSI